MRAMQTLSRKNPQRFQVQRNVGHIIINLGLFEPQNNDSVKLL